MSAAHRKFSGLRTHKSVDSHGDPFYLGSPCLYHAHSTKTGEASIHLDKTKEPYSCLAIMSITLNPRRNITVSAYALQYFHLLRDACLIRGIKVSLKHVS